MTRPHRFPSSRSVLRGEYVRRTDPIDPRAEAGDAVDHYGERFRVLFKDAGAGMANAGDKVAGAAERVGDWLRSGDRG